MIVIIYAAFLSAWNHCELLVNRGDWKAKWFRKFMFWKTDQNDPVVSKGDSFHIIYNAFVVILIMGMFYATEEIYFLWMPLKIWFLDGLIALVYFFWWPRNVFMHIILRKTNREWYYFAPPPIPAIIKFIKKRRS